MNVFIWVYDDRKKFLDLKYPQELAKFVEKKKTKDECKYYVQFFRLKRKKMEMEWSSDKKAPNFNPSKDMLFLYVDALWEGNESIQLELMKGIASTLKKANTRYSVKLISYYGAQEVLKERIESFKKIFGKRIYDFVEVYYGYDSPGMRADFSAQELNEIVERIELTESERFKKHLPKDVKEEMHGMRTTWPEF